MELENVLLNIEGEESSSGEVKVGCESVEKGAESFHRNEDEVQGGGSDNNEQVTYKDTATWTAEDDMPSPVESSPVDSPIHSSQSNNTSNSNINNNFHSIPEFQFEPEHRHHHQHGGGRNRHHKRSQKIANPKQVEECFTVSSQLMNREARLYENVPSTASGLDNLGVLLSEIHPSGERHGGQQQFDLKNNSGNFISNHELSVSDLLGVVVPGPPSRASWGDSGRESLSFDGENNNSNESSGKMMYPPPPPINTNPGSSTAYNNDGTMITHHFHYQHQQQHCPSPSHRGMSSGYTNNGHQNHHQQHHQHHQHQHHNHGKKTSSRRERLVRQKEAIEETFHPIEKSPRELGGGGNGGGYLAVPSPRRGVLPSGVIASNLVSSAASPINLQRHPNSAELLLQENKKSHSLMPCESPYILNTTVNDWNCSRRKSPQGRASVSGCSGGGGGSALLSNVNITGGAIGLSRLGGGGNGKNRHGQGQGQQQHQSFDYGELPSHQMFPKRHLLAQGTRHFFQQPPPAASMLSSEQNGKSDNHHHQCPVPPGAAHLIGTQQHRSFPAGLFSGVAPRSCSMGDLTGANNGPNGVNPMDPHGSKSPEQNAIIGSATTGGITSNNVSLVTSLPLPPAASVTYEFSLAPVSGTLAPGWHLTAVQRGLATAVPLAAVVARRRLPRPRPTMRQRLGFTDKNEARRAKWTIVITALALLAMSMLLVGVTLRLAPLIDDLVRKENEHLLKVIQQSSLNVTTVSSSPTSTMFQSENTNDSVNNNNYNIGSSDSQNNNGQSLPRTTDMNPESDDDYSSSYNNNDDSSVQTEKKGQLRADDLGGDDPDQ